MQFPSSLLTLLATSPFLLSVQANPLPNNIPPANCHRQPYHTDQRCLDSGFGWVDPGCHGGWCITPSATTTTTTATSTAGSRRPIDGFNHRCRRGQCWMQRPPLANVPLIPSAYCFFIGGCVRTGTATATVRSTVTANATLTMTSSHASSTPMSTSHAPSTLTITPTLTTTFTVLETLTPTTTTTQRKHRPGAEIICQGENPVCHEMWDAMTLTLERRARPMETVTVPENDDNDNEDNDNEDNDNNDDENNDDNKDNTPLPLCPETDLACLHA